MPDGCLFISETCAHCHRNTKRNPRVQSGSFVVHTSPRAFSSIALDRVHEPANASVKADGGAVGLTESWCFIATDGSRT